MKRELSIVWHLLLLPALGGCVANGPAGSDPPAVVSPSPLQVLTPPGAPAQPIPVNLVADRKRDSLNVFPSWFGDAPLLDATHRLVPQERGQDKRAPAATKLEFVGAPAGTLVVYDSTGPYGWLGELYAIAALNVASHFGAVTSKPVAQYVAGDMAPYKAVIYVGSTYNETLPGYSSMCSSPSA